MTNMILTTVVMNMIVMSTLDNEHATIALTNIHHHRNSANRFGRHVKLPTGDVASREFNKGQGRNVGDLT